MSGIPRVLTFLFVLHMARMQIDGSFMAAGIFYIGPLLWESS